ncbi:MULTISPECIES: peptide deformylase [Apibacter]|uniref:peptide deformylase n=1 Tax=Apibacter TaxID=1778601 RepID=UPI001329DB86|nr:MULTISPECIES: peptide deformylase [Apibacter]MCX8676352.1 peptide deformylase [Apibacter sp. B3919]MXO23817.1 peptide deformylase [Apibacter sp. B3924]MXO26505.1 peptide deformylase [Apibacter sp. B3813]MXO28457.1 peptide deformylase [Apibacter sp. B3913]MXO30411.1 peptide deformylase [Apibacter sp. B3912]
MILPIYGYGEPVLRKKTVEIGKDYPDLDQLIENMYETMYKAHGIGLAAPQVGLNIRLFVIDASPLAEDEDYVDIKDELALCKKVFINPKITKRDGELWKFNEGCLSIPDIREDIKRLENITIEYFDQNWNKKTENFGDVRARIIQHEYDHIEGILFTDLLSPLKKKLLKGKLANISKGKVETEYRMKFPSH